MEVVDMKFKIEKPEYITKTLRFEKEMVDEVNKICDEQNISFNALVVQSIKFALEHLDDEE